MKIFAMRWTAIALTGAFLTATSAGAATEKVIYSFKDFRAGANPHAGLISLGGKFYGTTFYGGPHGGGEVFSVTGAGIKKVVHSFRCEGGAAMLRHSSAAQSCSDGANPGSGLIKVGGTLYGTTTEFGENGCCGAVYSVTPAGSEKVLYAFQGGNDGNSPEAGLIEVDGVLYGTTALGGGTGCDGFGCGTVFALTGTGAETVVHAFQGGNDGSEPLAGLIDVGGTLYGTTSGGGENGRGTVFDVTKAGVEKVVYAFKGGKDGQFPQAGLLDVGGTLYGTTASGGGFDNCDGDCGTVFSVTPSGAETVLYAFKGKKDGGSPMAGLIDMGGTFYGTTFQGGTGTLGTVFSVTPTGTETVLHSFGGDGDASNPLDGVIDVGGTLYGTTLDGGDDFGAVFSVNP
jgi:uncharacterized repeat protein (TIGR03803 family)